jgi:hypothetical protein
MRSLLFVGDRYMACIIKVKKKLAEDNVFISSLSYLMMLLVTQTIQHQINAKACSREQSWPNLMYYPGIFREALKKTVKNLKQGSRYLG